MLLIPHQEPMIKGINRSVTGFVLSAFLGTAYSVPSLAQSSSPQTSSSQTVTSADASPTQAATAPLLESAYTLGAGDLIRVDIFDTPELVLETRYTVLLDGTVNLPWIGGTPVQGLTLNQAAAALTEKYRRFIRNPIITVSLAAARPLKIGVIGEVNRPGSYIISVIGSETSQTSLSQRTVSSTEGASQWPTVSKAIQTAGGITQLANVRQIKVRRPVGSGRENVINVDLWRFLQEGDLTQDMILRDGDTIEIPKGGELKPDEVTQVAASNFSPETIKVNVVGEVVTPGSVTVRPNTTLNQAVLAAGGLKNNRARKTNIELIRLNPDGTVTRRKLALDLNQGLNEANNPALHNNDVVVVNRNGVAKFSDLIGTVLSPVTGLFGLLTILGR